MHKQGHKGEKLNYNSSENNSNQINVLRRVWMFSSSTVFPTMGKNQENAISFHECFPHQNKTQILSSAFMKYPSFDWKDKEFLLFSFFPPASDSFSLPYFQTKIDNRLLLWEVSQKRKGESIVSSWKDLTKPNVLAEIHFSENVPINSMLFI